MACGVATSGSFIALHCAVDKLQRLWRLLIPDLAAGLQAVAQASADAFAAASNDKTKAVACASADALATAISKVRVQLKLSFRTFPGP